MNGTTKTFELRVTGMTCGSCAARVERALKLLPAVQGVQVDLQKRAVHVVAAAETAVSALEEAIRNAGYGIASDAPPVSGGAASCHA